MMWSDISPGMDMRRLDRLLALYQGGAVDHPVRKAIAGLEPGEGHSFTSEAFNENVEGMWYSLCAWQRTYGWIGYVIEFDHERDAYTVTAPNR